MAPVQYEAPPTPTGADISAVPSIGTAAADTTLSDALLTLRKRKWIILALGLAGLIYGFYQYAVQPRLYEAYGTIEIRTGSSNEYRIIGTGSNTDTSSSSLLTQIAILKSDTLLLTVARDLNLANNPYFMGDKGPAPYRNIDDPVIRQSVLGAMQAIVSVSLVPKTDLVRISCSTFNPKLSADIVNKLVREYILRSFQSRADATQRVSEFFSHQLDDLKQEVQTSQEQMIDLQKRLGVLGFDPNLNQTTSNLADLSKAVGEARIARINAETHLAVLTGRNSNAANQPLNAGLVSPAVSSLRAQLELDRANLAQLTAPKNLGPNHPQVEALRQKIDELSREISEEQNRVIAEAQEAVIATRANEQQTQAALDAQTAAAYKLRNDLIEYTLRQRDFDSNRTLYEGLLQRLRTAGVEAGLESTEIDIVDAAVPPVGPTLRPRTTILVIDTAMMLVLGIILAFVLDSLDTSLRTVAEIEAVSGLPSLALIPRVRRSSAETANLGPAMRNLIVLSSPKSQFAEAFRALRTSLLLSVAGGEPKLILLTSATPSEGKTTVSINLACVLAQRDVRVLLIDADLRRPTVHHRFGLNGKAGLTSVLTGAVPLEEAIQNIPEMPLLDILVSGPVPPFPTEMLSSQTMVQLLEKCKGIYTHIVMDSPPLLSVTDSVVLARDADAVLLIIRHGKSSKHALRRARDLLVRSGAPVTGTALNAVDLNSPEYYSYYGYYGYTGYASAGVDSAGWETKSGDGSGPGDSGTPGSDGGNR